MLEFLPLLFDGMLITVTVTLEAAVLAVVVALIAGLGRLSSFAPLRWLAVTYVELFRGTSLLVQLFWWFFVLPLPPFEIYMSALTVAVLGIGLNVGAYGAEVVRAAIIAVPKSQVEAAIALNLSAFTRMRRIILPQALIAMLPPWGNLFIELLKGTALVSLITLNDLTFRATQLNTVTFRTIEIFTMAMIMYFLLSQIIAFAMRRLEAWASRGIVRERT